MKVFVVIPAYNEETRIAQVLSKLAVLLYQVVVVDDASQDKTCEVVLKFPQVVLLRHRLNRQQGAALETGNQYALKHGADIIVHFDADGQFLVADIAELIKPIIESDYQVVLGSRFLSKKSELPRLKEYLFFPVARLVNYLFFNITTTDPQSGLRAFSKEVADKLSVEQDGMAHCSEILAKIFQYKLKVKEVPITVLYHHFGQNFGGGLKIIRDLLFSKISK